MIELALFLSTFVSVFALGFQSQNVNQGHYVGAAITSIAISAGHIALYRYMPEARIEQIAAYFLGGILGITASIYAHRRTLGRKHREAWAADMEGRITQRVLELIAEEMRAGHVELRFTAQRQATIPAKSATVVPLRPTGIVGAHWPNPIPASRPAMRAVPCHDSPEGCAAPEGLRPCLEVCILQKLDRHN